jgi:hypothetical protein
LGLGLMGKQTIFVEIDPETELPIRILKHWAHASQLDQDVVRSMARSVAVGYIRNQVIARAIRNKNILCEFCGNIITPGTGHMHEKIAKGDGGEVSLDNCVFICPRCHIGSDGEHGDRQWMGRKEKYGTNRSD